jgi:gamma-glutamylputrescine oxidase
MHMPGYGARFWAERTPDSRRRSYPTFRGDATADVVVIGGGLIGCAVAYALAAADVDVVLLEAGRLADGATAGGLGAILPQPDAEYLPVERAAGLRVARDAWKEAHRGALEMATTIRKLGIKCDLTPSDLIVNAITSDDQLDLRREQAARKKAGLDAPLLTARMARPALGQESAGAIRIHGASEFDPVRAALGFAAAAAAAGARVFEKSLVKRTRFTRRDAQVVLGGGALRTRGVVVATAEPGALFGQLRRHVRRQEGYAVVTHPLPAAMRREVGPRKGILTEVGTNPHWLRWLADDRILFTGALGAPTSDRQRSKVLVQRTAQLMYELSLRYPAISGLPAAWGWHTPVVTTPDGLPWLGPHRNYPHHFFALATGWHGDSLAWFAAKAAVRHFRGEARREDAAFGFGRYL